MAWRLARSLSVLRLEANSVAPHRSKALDGTIGDASHQNRPSRHNPNREGVVCALDLTHDPRGGMNTYTLFNFLAANPHEDMYYAISNGRIVHRRDGFRVRPYTGSSRHDRHIHIAVGRGPDSDPMPPYDDLYSWHLRKWAGLEEEEEMTQEQFDAILGELRKTNTFLEELRYVVGTGDSYRAAILNALVADEQDEVKRLNDEAWNRDHPIATGLPEGWDGNP